MARKTKTVREFQADLAAAAALALGQIENEDMAMSDTSEFENGDTIPQEILDAGTEDVTTEEAPTGEIFDVDSDALYDETETVEATPDGEKPAKTKRVKKEKVAKEPKTPSEYAGLSNHQKNRRIALKTYGTRPDYTGNDFRVHIREDIRKQIQAVLDGGTVRPSAKGRSHGGDRYLIQLAKMGWPENGATIEYPDELETNKAARAAEKAAAKAIADAAKAQAKAEKAAAAAANEGQEAPKRVRKAKVIVATSDATAVSDNDVTIDEPSESQVLDDVVSDFAAS